MVKFVQFYFTTNFARFCCVFRMNSSLHEIQSDLQRLASQQNQMQNPPVQSSPQPMQSFATLQNSFVNSRPVNYVTQPQPQIHSLVYSTPGTGWHSLVSQSPPPPVQPQQPPAFTHHNNFLNQQPQVSRYLHHVHLRIKSVNLIGVYCVAISL